MFIKTIIGVITTLVVFFWLAGRLHNQIPNPSGKVDTAFGDQGENKDELDDAQAAEIVATWNVLILLRREKVVNGKSLIETTF